MHKIAVLALQGVVPFDLGIPCIVFDTVHIENKPVYDVTVCSEAPQIKTRHFDVQTKASLAILATADTIIIPGIDNSFLTISDEVINALTTAKERGARIASICSGAFVLAAAGLLNGRRATTHWFDCGRLAQRYPKINVDPDVLFVDEGQILTSAGLSAGVDMCLHLIRRDFGQGAAAAAARFTVAQLDRDGGQAQFIHHEPPQSRASLAPVLEWAQNHLTQSLNVEVLAVQSGMSMRTFHRRFREQTGVTPTKWLLMARIKRAQDLLENSNSSIEKIASESGFDSPVTFRSRFKSEVGVAPTVYRQRFNAQGAPKAGLRRRSSLV